MWLEAYFIAGIGGVLSSLFLKKALGGSSALFTHGKSKVPSAHEPNPTKFLARFTVPKSWFWHFYTVGLVVSAVKLHEAFSLPALLLLVQCCRRLVESFTVMPGGKGSEMHMIHYFIGMSYYPILLLSLNSYQTSQYAVYCVVGFAVASGLQFYCHCILGKERAKAQIQMRPITNPLFRFLHAPHYFAEFCIYFCLAALGSFPLLSVLNLMWIATMLGVSAYNSANWLCQAWKFKSHQAICRYIMFPFVF
jgi:3-oxo-5-alpha-steroid 4-dehydrogenase 3